MDASHGEWTGGGVPEAVCAVFGPNIGLANRLVELLATDGVTRGLIGPREVERLWSRHMLNSAVLGERIASGSSVIDVGSGAGFPGIPLALARPDVSVLLLEPMARRVAWLSEVIDMLGVPIGVVRGRAEDAATRRHVGTADIVTARAVAPLGRLAGWCLPLTRPGGTLLAVKGASAASELDRDADEVARCGGKNPALVECGGDMLDTPTTVVTIDRRRSGPSQEADKRRNNRRARR